MNIKKILSSAVIGLGVVALAGAATAATTTEINIYGASAEYLYWNAAALGFVKAQGYTTNVGQAATSDKKHGITKGEKSNGDMLIIRYSSKASYDGIYAVKDSFYPGTHDDCATGDMRKMADLAQVTSWTTDSANPGVCGGTTCVRVTLGASDVAGETFNQSSYGNLYGPYGGGVISRAVSKIDTSMLVPFRPLVVPFAFFVNKTVKRDYDGNGVWTSWVSATNPGEVLQNVPRIMAVLIFSGQAGYWDDFGDQFEGKQIVRCFRHAGSGTHATLDAAVMHADWGGQLLSSQTSTTFFNDSSADEMKCIDYNGGKSTSAYGAIGYADADQSLTDYPNTWQVKYNGEAATKYNIENCLYDFWSAQWLFARSGETTGTLGTLIQNLYNYAKDSGNMPDSKKAYWATADEMLCEKIPGDINYPSAK